MAQIGHIDLQWEEPAGMTCRYRTANLCLIVSGLMLGDLLNLQGLTKGRGGGRPQHIEDKTRDTCISFLAVAGGGGGRGAWGSRR